MGSSSTRSALDHDLQTIRDDILRMGSLVDKAIEQAFEAFRLHDLALAQQVVNDDKVINDLRYKAEYQVNSTMALQQPMAHDLRLLLSSLIIVNELERIGDHAVGIARTVSRDPGDPAREPPRELVEMADHVRAMLRQALDAFISEDVQKAEDAAAMDNRVDTLYRGLFDMLVEQMGEGVISVERGTYLLWAGHNMERNGDRVTNICERIIFTSTGRIGPELNPKSRAE